MYEQCAKSNVREVSSAFFVSLWNLLPRYFKIGKVEMSKIL